MNNQEKNEKNMTAPLCLGFTQKGLPCKKRGCVKYGGFCATHSPADTLPRCYYIHPDSSKGRCSGKCRKGKIYCKEHRDYTPFISWGVNTPFVECETSLKFVEFMRDYIQRGKTCPIKKRYDAIDNADKVAYYKADVKKFEETLTEYMKFVSVKYPIQYNETNLDLTKMGYAGRNRMLEMTNYKRVKFTTMNMSGENDAYNIMVKNMDEIYSIKEHIINDKFGGATDVYNLGLFLEGREDAVDTWTDDMEGSNFFCLASAENEKPLKLTTKSYKEGDRVIFVKGRTAGTNGTDKIAMGVIKHAFNGFFRIEEVLTQKLPQSVKVSWDTPYYGGNNPLHHLAVCFLKDIKSVQRWDTENPIYNDSKEWVENNHLLTL